MFLKNKVYRCKRERERESRTALSAGRGVHDHSKVLNKVLNIPSCGQGLDSGPQNMAVNSHPLVADTWSAILCCNHLCHTNPQHVNIMCVVPCRHTPLCQPLGGRFCMTNTCDLSVCRYQVVLCCPIRINLPTLQNVTDLQVTMVVANQQLPFLGVDLQRPLEFTALCQGQQVVQLLPEGALPWRGTRLGLLPDIWAGFWKQRSKMKKTKIGAN